MAGLGANFVFANSLVASAELNSSLQGQPARHVCAVPLGLSVMFFLAVL